MVNSKQIDITGQRFGILTTIKYIGGNGNRWECKCDCGKIISAGSYTLRDGRFKSCGCNNPNKFQDLTGRKYGLIEVISFSHKEGKGSGKSINFWKCKCDCGNETVVRRSHLNNGKIKSCGCLLSRTGKDSPQFKGYEELSGWYYGSLKRGSTYKGRNFEFSVSLEFLWNLFIKQNRKCALTGLEITFPKKVLAPRCDNSASLDRIDSSKGYIESNVQWLHKDVNIMKNHFDQNHFIDLCRKISNNVTI